MLVHKTSRREFIKRATVFGAAGYLVANAAELRANPLGLPIGSQVYPLRSMLKDFPIASRSSEQPKSPSGRGVDSTARGRERNRPKKSNIF